MNRGITDLFCMHVIKIQTLLYSDVPLEIAFEHYMNRHDDKMALQLHFHLILHTRRIT